MLTFVFDSDLQDTDDDEVAVVIVMREDDEAAAAVNDIVQEALHVDGICHLNNLLFTVTF